VTGAGVIATFHERRLLSLMRRAHHLEEMVSNTPLEGTMLMTGELDHEEIKKHIKLALGSVPSDAVLNVHPPMHPDDNFIEMVSASHSSYPLPFPWPLSVPFCLTRGSGGCRGISTWSSTSTHPFLRTQSKGHGTRLRSRG
jgi:hypothetical protein